MCCYFMKSAPTASGHARNAVIINPFDKGLSTPEPYTPISYFEQHPLGSRAEKFQKDGGMTT